MLAIIAGALATFSAAADPTEDFLAGKIRWTATAPLIAAADRADDPCVAIKDPTFVRYQDKWELFATIKCRSGTKMEHLSFADWKTANAAPRHVIALVPNYHCAPQVFYFTPQKKWYLIYQWGDDSRKYFGPCFSTLDDPSKPQTLTRPVMLYAEKPKNVPGWLDFWVICDGPAAHLFFTTLNGQMWRAQTPIDKFPHGWDQPRIVLQGDIFEASHTYKLKGAQRFLTIVEAQASAGRRYYKAYAAEQLDGKWTPLADTLEKPFAGQANVAFDEGVEPWTDSISHGELVRDGVDESMTMDPANLQFLFQGCNAKDRADKGYGQFPWRLGMLRNR
jgi:Glycosyl hydrolase family 62